MTFVENVPALPPAETLAAIEEVVQEAVTERSADDNETAIELARIHSEAETERARIEADAAVEIAGTIEVDDEWLRSQFAALAVGQENILLQLAQLATDIQTVAIAVIASGSTQSTPTPPAEPPAPAPAEPPAPEPPVQNAPEPPATQEKRRIRRFM